MGRINWSFGRKKREKAHAWAPDWTDISDEAVAYLLEEAKENLRGTVELGINTDQRAAALFAGFSTGAFALFAVSGTISVGEHVNVYWLLISMSAGIFFLGAAFICLQAMQPRDFYVGGYEPRKLYASATDILWLQRYTIEDIQSRIDANRMEIEREASLINTAITILKVGLTGVGLSIVYVVFITDEFGMAEFIHLF